MAYYVANAADDSRTSSSFRFQKRFLLIFIAINIVTSIAIGVIGLNSLKDLQSQGEVSVEEVDSERRTLIASLTIGSFLSLFGMVAIFNEHWLFIASYAASLLLIVLCNLFYRMQTVTIVNIVTWTALACFSIMFSFAVRRNDRRSEYIYLA